MGVRGRSLVRFGGALAFGLGLGLLHGNDGGLRGALGNLSAPWLFVALVPAWWSGSAMRGAVVGTIATMVALVGFYLGLTATMLGHLGAVHGVVASLVFVLRANRIWFVAGLMSGPLCGLASGWAGRRFRPVWLGAALGSLLLGEIVVVYGVSGIALPVLNLRWAATDWRGYEMEAVLGLLILIALAVRSRRATRAPSGN